MVEPAFIIGCPRSGTTIALDLTSSHESFAWVSNILNLIPNRLDLTLLNRAYDIPFLRKLLLKKKRLRRLLRPAEPWAFWNTHLSRFQWKRGGQIPPRRRNEDDITPEEIRSIHSAVNSICKYQNKTRFLSKYTDFPRIKYLTQAFPDAIFVHVVRDGRAVAYSYYNKIKTRRWTTWKEREWWVRGWPDSERMEWMEKHGDCLSFCAYQWKFFVDGIWEDAHILPRNQYLELNYRDLMNSPSTVLRSILEFCGLEMTSRVDWYLTHVTLTNMNYKWQEELDTEQKTILENVITEERFKRLLDD